MPLRREVEALFPGLSAGYEETSDPDEHYNCIGHAAGENDTWWDPGPGRYWPRRVPRNYAPESLMAALATIGYTRCVSEEFEAGVEKIAIFVGVDGEYSHVARQLAEGQWTSKIGKAHDISH